MGLSLVFPGKVLLTGKRRLRDCPPLFQRRLEVAGAQALLVGLPRHKDGQESATAPLARAFGEALRDLTGLPLLFWDEHLTSMEAERLLAQRGVKAKDRKARLDAAAAAVMLEDLMETRSSRRIPVGQFGS